MKGSAYQRVNISLPSTTLKRIDTIAEHGDRSRLIDTAVNLYLNQHSRTQLEEAIKEESIHWRKRDRQIAKEWAAGLDFSRRQIVSDKDQGSRGRSQSR